MIRHVFLTGAKGIGKSTLLRKALGSCTGDIGGFFTVRTDAFLPGERSVHLFRADEAPVPSGDNLLFVCGRPDAGAPERFDYLGRRALDGRCSLFVLDELGPHEGDALLFRRAVLALLDGGVPVLGVLQAPAERFWPDIVHHPAVQVLEITEDNRDRKEIAERIASVIAAPI